MAFNDLSVNLDKLMAFEGETLKRHQAHTPLGLAENDVHMSNEAESEVKMDVIDLTNKYFFDSTYSDLASLLDDLAEKDTENMLERLMSIKFLELFFADQTLSGDSAEEKATFYERKYEAEKTKVVNMLLSYLDKPKIPNRVRFSR
jgi:hypothetical protein